MTRETPEVRSDKRKPREKKREKKERKRERKKEKTRENKLKKLRRHASPVHFAKIHLG